MKFKVILSIMVGFILTYFRQYAILFLLVAAAEIIDLATGVVASVIDGTGLSSKIARKGLLKKIVLLIAVAFGTFLDILLPMCAEYTGIVIPKSMLFSTVICVYICITESISIVENIYRCVGIKLPEWILKLLKDAKDSLDKRNKDEK